MRYIGTAGTTALAKLFEGITLGAACGFRVVGVGSGGDSLCVSTYRFVDMQTPHSYQLWF